MKKAIGFVFSIIALAAVCQLIIGLPWWSVFVVSLLVSYLFIKKESSAFLIGFCAIFLFWGAASFTYDHANDSILSSKVGALFMGLGSWGLIAVTAVFGGLVGGLGSWTGNLMKKLLYKS